MCSRLGAFGKGQEEGRQKRIGAKRLIFSVDPPPKQETPANAYDILKDWRLDSKQVCGTKLPNELYKVVENQIVETPTSKNREIQKDEIDTDDNVSRIEEMNQVFRI